jgi:mRNA interferase RelE/StbE
VADYAVEVRAGVRKALRKLDETVRKDLLATMRSLADDPRPPGVRPLTGHRPWPRVRVGNYRVIYAVDDAMRVITIAVVGHRREVYRGLDL